jgi:hypothetical protein
LEVGTALIGEVDEIETAEVDLSEAAIEENVSAGTAVEELIVVIEGAADAAVVLGVAAEAAEGEAWEDSFADARF